MRSEVEVHPVTCLVSRDTWSTCPGTRGSSEEWLTKKKVEIVTRKNVEKTVKRQLVLEDGRILDEDEPIVTVDTTENKEIFETDADEERDNGYRTGAGDMNIGDRVTTLRTVKDVRENVMKTEAAENVGIIADRDIAGVMRDKKSLGRVLMRGEESRELRSVKTVPVVVENSRNHSTVTNTEEVKERKMKRGGRMMTETIRTEEREVYESNDSETSDDEADHDVVEYEHLETEEPREYKTKTEESFIEYFQRGSSGDRMRMVKVGSGPHYKTEQNHFSKNINSRKPLKQSRSWDNDTQDKLRSSSLSSHHTTSLNDLNKQGADRVFIAKVIDETPTVRLRNKKKEDINRYIEHRQSANFSSLGTPIRSSTPVHSSSRCSTPTSKEYHFRNCRVKERGARRERPMSLDISKFYQSAPEQSQSRVETSSSQHFSTLRNQRSYHSNLDISDIRPKQIEITIESPGRGEMRVVPAMRCSSSDDILNSVKQERNVTTKSLVRKRDKFQSVGDICFTTSKEIPSLKKEVSFENSKTVSRRTNNDRKMSGQLIFTSEKPRTNVLMSSTLPAKKEKSLTMPAKLETVKAMPAKKEKSHNIPAKLETVKAMPAKQGMYNTLPAKHETIKMFPTKSYDQSFKTPSFTNLSTRIIPIDVSGPMSPFSDDPMSPSTKYKTRVAVQGERMR